MNVRRETEIVQLCRWVSPLLFASVGFCACRLPRGAGSGFVFHPRVTQRPRITADNRGGDTLQGQRMGALKM